MKIAVISDIHEDIVSLRQAMKKIEKNNCDEIICLGDISGFSVPYYTYIQSRNAHKCLSVIRANCNIIILGNHDLYAIRKVPENDQVFDYPPNWYQLDYYERLEMSSGMLWLYDDDELNPLYSKNDIEFLSSLPEYHILETKTKNILLSHYIYPNLTGSVKEFHTSNYDFLEHLEFIKSKECLYSIVGHAHAEGIYMATEQKIIQKGFKKHCLMAHNSCIVVPAIADSVNKNGFLIFDTDNFEMKAINI